MPSFSDNGFWPGFQWVGGGLSDLRNIGLLIMRNRLASASRLRRLMSESESEELDNDRPLRVRTGDMRSRRPSLRGGLLRRPKLSCLPNTRLSGDIRRLRSAERDRDLLLSTEPEFLLSSRDLADCRRSGERFCLCNGCLSPDFDLDCDLLCLSPLALGSSPLLSLLLSTDPDLCLSRDLSSFLEFWRSLLSFCPTFSADGDRRRLDESSRRLSLSLIILMEDSDFLRLPERSRLSLVSEWLCLSAFEPSLPSLLSDFSESVLFRFSLALFSFSLSVSESLLDSDWLLPLCLFFLPSRSFLALSLESFFLLLSSFSLSDSSLLSLFLSRLCLFLCLSSFLCFLCFLLSFLSFFCFSLLSSSLSSSISPSSLPSDCSCMKMRSFAATVTTCDSVRDPKRDLAEGRSVCCSRSPLTHLSSVGCSS